MLAEVMAVAATDAARVVVGTVVVRAAEAMAETKGAAVRAAARAAEAMAKEKVAVTVAAATAMAVVVANA